MAAILHVACFMLPISIVPLSIRIASPPQRAFSDSKVYVQTVDPESASLETLILLSAVTSLKKLVRILRG